MLNDPNAVPILDPFDPFNPSRAYAEFEKWMDRELEKLEQKWRSIRPARVADRAVFRITSSGRPQHD